MNRQQTTAFKHPCFEAHETINPKFAHVFNAHGRDWRVNLTANFGLE